MSAQHVTVIGATGHVGRHAVEHLHTRGVTVRAVSRRPDRVRFAAGVETSAADLTHPSSIAAAVAGTDAVFLVVASDNADEFAPAIVDALADQVGRIVYLSVEGASDDRLGEPGILGSHSRFERLIADSPASWTFLRSGGMATNALLWADDIAGSGVVRWPFPDAARPLVHEADLGEVAAHVLTTPGHEGRGYVLTGAEVLTHREVAETIGRVIGVELGFETIPRAAMRHEMLNAWGLDAETAEEMLDAWAAMAVDPGQPSGEVERLLGHPPHRFEQWARDHVGDFRRDGT